MSDTEPVDFSSRSGVTALIRAASITLGGQIEVARRLGRARSIVSAWNVGDRRPSPEEEARIASYARMSDPKLVDAYCAYLFEVAAKLSAIASTEDRSWEPSRGEEVVTEGES